MMGFFKTLFQFALGATFCSAFLWFIAIPYIEENFTEYAFVMFVVSVCSISMLCNALMVFWYKMIARARAINQVSKNIDVMLKSGMTLEEVIKELDLKVEEDPLIEVEPGLDPDNGIKAIKITYDPLTEITGYYNGEPIYDRIKLANGKTAIFDGVHDMKFKIDPSKIKESTMILESGIIYTLEK